jgi:hypothetical protein
MGFGYLRIIVATNNSLNLPARHARARFVEAAQQVFGVVFKLAAV